MRSVRVKAWWEVVAIVGGGYCIWEASKGSFIAATCDCSRKLRPQFALAQSALTVLIIQAGTIPPLRRRYRGNPFV